MFVGIFDMDYFTANGLMIDDCVGKNIEMFWKEQQITQPYGPSYNRTLLGIRNSSFSLTM